MTVESRVLDTLLNRGIAVALDQAAARRLRFREPRLIASTVELEYCPNGTGNYSVRHIHRHVTVYADWEYLACAAESNEQLANQDRQVA